MKTSPIASAILVTSLLLSSPAGAAMTHTDKELIGNTRSTHAKELTCFCLDRNENILAGDEPGKCIRVISPANALLQTWSLDFGPQAICCRTDGTVVVGGSGRVVLLDPTGKTLASATLPAPPMPVLKGKTLSGEELASRLRYMSAVTSTTSAGDDIFVCSRGNSGYNVYRMNSKLEDITPVIKGLSGCCGQMDITARGDTVYVAHNGSSEVFLYNRDGKKTGSFGKDKANRDSYFNGCCEPKNVCIGPDGSIYAAESAQCCINRFSPTGTLLDRTGIVKGNTGCVRVTVAVNHDASRIYMLDTGKNVVHVLTRNSSPR